MVRVELLKESLFIALFQEFSMRLCQKASRCHMTGEDENRAGKRSETYPTILPHRDQLWSVSGAKCVLRRGFCLWGWSMLRKYNDMARDWFRHR